MKSIDNIKSILECGENYFVDFKEELPTGKELAKELIAFSNSDGGIIVLGVNDKGVITGIAIEGLEEKVMNICRENCKPMLRVEFKYVDIDRKRIAIISIPTGAYRPYWTIDGRCYVRVGSTKRIASTEEITSLLQVSGKFNYDESLIDLTSIKDLNLEVIRDYYVKFNDLDIDEEPKEHLLKNVGLMGEIGTRSVCTVAGILLFGKDTEKHIPNSGINFAHFLGDSIDSELIDKKNINGRLTDVVEKMESVFSTNILVPSDIIGMKREEKIYYPKKVLREAVVNAIVHRDYSIAGAKIRIFMFSDRIEFRSPGRLMDNVTVEKMRCGISKARNTVLVRYMENLRYIDYLGRGIPTIFKCMRDIDAPEPELEEAGYEFVLTIYKGNGNTVKH